MLFLVVHRKIGRSTHSLNLRHHIQCLLQKLLELLLTGYRLYFLHVLDVFENREDEVLISLVHDLSLDGLKSLGDKVRVLVSENEQLLQNQVPLLRVCPEVRVEQGVDVLDESVKEVRVKEGVSLDVVGKRLLRQQGAVDLSQMAESLVEEFLDQKVVFSLNEILLNEFGGESLYLK